MSAPIAGTEILPKQITGGHLAPFVEPSNLATNPNTQFGISKGLFQLIVPSGTTTALTGPIFQPKNDVFITDVMARNLTSTGITGTILLYNVPLVGIPVEIASLVFTNTAYEVVRATQMFPGSLVFGFSAGQRVVAYSAVMSGPGAEVFIDFFNATI